LFSFAKVAYQLEVKQNSIHSPGVVLQYPIHKSRRTKSAKPSASKQRAEKYQWQVGGKIHRNKKDHNFLRARCKINKNKLVFFATSERLF